MKKKYLILITISLIFFYMLLLFLSIDFSFIHHYKGSNFVYNWSCEDKFDVHEDTAIVYKKKKKDFVILNLADIQICDIEDFTNKYIVHDEITYLVNTVKPDLITLTGDQTWSNENLLSLNTIIGWLDAYKIPYAPIFGNHDCGNSYNSAVASMNYCCDLYEKGKYSLFRRGPTNLGTLGNYVVNIMEDNKIYKTLYMMDSGYLDKITDEQIAWFKWNAEGIKEFNNGEYSDGAVFIHKPLPEYRSAFNSWLFGYSEAVGDVHVNFSLSGSSQNAFFDEAKQRGVSDVVCGHQHGNNFTINFEGVRLTFAVKTSQTMSYYDDGETNLNGATILKISATNTEVEHFLLKSGMFQIPKSKNVYKNY